MTEQTPAPDAWMEEARKEFEAWHTRKYGRAYTVWLEAKGRYSWDLTNELWSAWKECHLAHLRLRAAIPIPPEPAWRMLNDNEFAALLNDVGDPCTHEMLFAIQRKFVEVNSVHPTAPSGQVPEPEQQGLDYSALTPPTVPAAVHVETPCSLAGAATTEQEAPQELPIIDGQQIDRAMYGTALGLVRKEGRVSISFVQRHMKIGYNAAARLIEAMEMMGEVSSQNAQGVRRLLSKGAA